MKSEQEIRARIDREYAELRFLQSFDDMGHTIEANIPSAKINALKWVLEG